MLEYIEKIIFIKITVDTEMALMAKREQNYILVGAIRIDIPMYIRVYAHARSHTCARSCLECTRWLQRMLDDLLRGLEGTGRDIG